MKLAIEELLNAGEWTDNKGGEAGKIPSQRCRSCCTRMAQWSREWQQQKQFCTSQEKHTSGSNWRFPKRCTRVGAIPALGMPSCSLSCTRSFVSYSQ
eukprot:4472348-Amphidinium_carterae.1